jgi:hypothetical protein
VRAVTKMQKNLTNNNLNATRERELSPLLFVDRGSFCLFIPAASGVHYKYGSIYTSANNTYNLLLVNNISILILRSLTKGFNSLFHIQNKYLLNKYKCDVSSLGLWI